MFNVELVGALNFCPLLCLVSRNLPRMSDFVCSILTYLRKSHYVRVWYDRERHKEMYSPCNKMNECMVI